MKRSNGEGSCRKLKNGTWEGRVCIGRGLDGKMERRSVYGKTKREVIDKMADIAAEVNNGTYIAPEEMTLEEWLEIWKESYLNDIKPSTLAQYDYQIRIHIVPRMGSKKLQKITAPMIQAFYNQLVKPYELTNRFGKKVIRPGLSAKSVKNLHGVLHKAFQQALLCKFIRSNPCDACKLPRIEKTEMKAIQGKDVSTFIEEIKGDPYQYLYYIDLFTGMRQAEIIGLTWDCVDFKKGVIRIEKQFRKIHAGGMQYEFSSLKNGKKRTISPALIVFDVLRKVKAEQSRWKLQAGEAFNNEYNFVFTNELGEHLYSVTVYNHLKKILHRIGLGDIRFHDLRHSFAAISLQNGDDIKTVSENLGHATVAFTLDVYGHVTEKMRKDSADRMQAFIKSL